VEPLVAARTTSPSALTSLGRIKGSRGSADLVEV
jgi:hypothetical protein